MLYFFLVLQYNIYSKFFFFKLKRQQTPEKYTAVDNEIEIICSKSVHPINLLSVIIFFFLKARWYGYLVSSCNNLWAMPNKDNVENIRYIRCVF
jgi:hypothetical protein